MTDDELHACWARYHRSGDRMDLPSLTVLAESHRISQRWIQEVGLGEFFRPRTTMDPHGLRGVRLFVRHESFDDWLAGLREGQRQDWEWSIEHLRATRGCREFTQSELEALRHADTPR